jgi:hypothetical protein
MLTLGLLRLLEVMCNVELCCLGLDADKLCKVIIYVKAYTFGRRSWGQEMQLRQPCLQALPLLPSEVVRCFASLS